MKILVVKYLPGREFSSTAVLYNYFKQLLSSEHLLKELDLELNPPPYFDYNTLMAYYKRNYQNKSLSNDEQKNIIRMDQLTDSLLENDMLLITSPMHNFGMPGVVKLWFDAVIQKGKTFDYSTDGSPYGLLKGKKALILFTSGAEYSSKQVSLNYPEWDTYSLHAMIMLKFLGFDTIEVITASTGNQQQKEKNIQIAKNKIEELLKKWHLTKY